MVDFSGLASIFDSFVVFHHSSTEDGQWRWSKNQFHPCCSFCQSAWHVDLFRGWGSTFDQTIAASLHVLVGPRFSRNVSSLWWPSKHVEHGTPTSCCQSLAYGTPSFGEGHGLMYFAFHHFQDMDIHGYPMDHGCVAPDDQGWLQSIQLPPVVISKQSSMTWVSRSLSTTSNGRWFDERFVNPQLDGATIKVGLQVSVLGSSAS